MKDEPIENDNFKEPPDVEKNILLKVIRFSLPGILLGLLGVAFLEKLYKLPPKTPTFPATGFWLDHPSTNYIQTSEILEDYSQDYSKYGYLRGGASGQLRKDAKPFVTLQQGRVTSLSAPANPATFAINAGKKANVSHTSQPSTSKALQMDQKVFPTIGQQLLEGPVYYEMCSKDEIKDVYTVYLGQPKMSYIDKNGKTVNLNYKGATKIGGPFQASFDMEGGFVTATGSITYYKDSSDEYKIFLARHEVITNALKEKNSSYTFEIRTEKKIDGKMEKASLVVEHPEGIKAHRATGREKADTLVLMKPHYINQALIEGRQVAERILMFEPSVDGLAGPRNKTNFAAGHTIHRYFDAVLDQTILSYVRINDDFFSPDFTREDYIAAERKVINLQRNQYIKERAARGMTEIEMLAQLWAGAAIDESLVGVRRFGTAVKEAFNYSNLPDNNYFLSSEDVQFFGIPVIRQCQETRSILLGLKKFFVTPYDTPSTEIHALEVVLDAHIKKHAMEVLGLLQTLDNCGVADLRETEAYFKDYSSVPQDERSARTLAFEANLDWMSPDDLDDLILKRQVQVFEIQSKKGAYQVPSKMRLMRITGRAYRLRTLIGLDTLGDFTLPIGENPYT